MAEWGEVRTLQQLLTNKPESLEETLIAPKLTKIEFPQFLRKVSASSVVGMNDWWWAAEWGGCGRMGRECVAKGVCCIHLNSLSRLSPSKSQCTVYVAQFVPPVVILSTIYQVTNHQPPVLSGHYKGATKEEACLKERPKRRWKEARPCLWTVQHNSPKTGKLGLLSPCLFGQFILIRAKKKADNQIVGSRFLATGFSSGIASIKFLSFAPTSTISLPSLCAGCIARGSVPD